MQSKVISSVPNLDICCHFYIRAGTTIQPAYRDPQWLSSIASDHRLLPLCGTESSQIVMVLSQYDPGY